MIPSLLSYIPLSPLISATVLKDSISREGVRLLTYELVYPRFIHSELMTHRVFSRNASSSRAIPVKRLLRMIRDNPAVPASWRMNEPGMQGFTVADETTTKLAEAIWLRAMDYALQQAQYMDDLGIHKQTVNRMTEPYAHIKVVLTSVYFGNWDGLRNHSAADPTIEALAVAMKSAADASTPKLLSAGEWHLPYVSDEELADLGIDNARKVSAARCARVSYNNHDGSKTELEKDIKLHDALLVSQPIHASPAEHQATPDDKRRLFRFFGPLRWSNPKRHGNLAGWCQYRKLLDHETMDRAV